MATRTISDYYHYGEPLLIPEGKTSTIFSGHNIANRKPVVIKEILKGDKLRWSNMGGAKLPLEIVLLTEASKIKGVAPLHDWFVDPVKFIMVIEKKAANVDLFDYIGEEGYLSETTAFRVMEQLVGILSDLSAMAILHADIKDENILIDRNTQKIQLIDFGAGYFYKQEETYTDFLGTWVYSPPEWVLLGHYRAEPALMWSLGILLYDMVVGDIPFHDGCGIIKGHLVFPPHVSAECISLVRSLLSYRPRDRPELKNISSFSWWRMHENA